MFIAGRQPQEGGEMTVKRYRVPPWLAVIGVVLGAGAIYVAFPLAPSLLGERHGWDGRRPGALNLVGLVPIVAGVGVYFWVQSRGLAAMRERDWKVFKIDTEHLLTPDFLVTDGPYRYTRNPMHLASMAVLGGWAVLLGSIPVAVVFGVIVVGIPVVARFEEAGLARQFGDEWERYAARTPRWLPTRRRPEST